MPVSVCRMKSVVSAGRNALDRVCRVRRVWAGVGGVRRRRVDRPQQALLGQVAAVAALAKSVLETVFGRPGRGSKSKLRLGSFLSAASVGLYLLRAYTLGRMRGGDSWLEARHR